MQVKDDAVEHLSSHRRGVILLPGDLSTPPDSQFLIVKLHYLYIS